MQTRRFLAVRILIALYRWVVALGWNPQQTALAIRGVPFLLRDAWRFRREPPLAGFSFARGTPCPCPADRFLEGGTARGAYFHQDLWAARHVFQAAPRRHLDVGSRIDGFVAHVASFREIEVIDIRPLTATVSNIRFRQLDLMGELTPADHGCCDSLSCLHALEHFGLGRYGDQVRADGFLRGWDNLYRLLAPGGILYFSVPLGPPRIEFNAHRIFSVDQLLRLVDSRYTVRDFAYVDDQGDLHRGKSLTESAAARQFDCFLGCALLALQKNG